MGLEEGFRRQGGLVVGTAGGWCLGSGGRGCGRDRLGRGQQWPWRRWEGEVKKEAAAGTVGSHWSSVVGRGRRRGRGLVIDGGGRAANEEH